MVMLYVLLFLPYFSLSRAEGAVLALTFGTVLAAEAINSAVERTIDRFSTEHHPLSGAAKDMAAGAVLLTAIAALGVAACLFGKWSVWCSIFADFRQHVYKPIALLLSFIPAGLFVVKWGTKS
jgi:diacylglycerol kinase